MSAPTATRLPRRPSARAERRREVRSAVLAALGLAVVLVGVPVALALAVGNPLPTSAPSRSWLTATVTADVVLKVLAAALWLAWAHFAACVLAEWRAARRGSGLATDVPLGGGSQVLARKLVAAVLLLSGAAAVVPAGSGDAPPARSELSLSAEVLAEAAPAAPVVEAAPVEAPAVVASGPLKAYVVQPPDGRRYDSLWDIAERTLGDPFRYKEVFELNRAKVQDDGRTLVDANLIHPGWVLVMPADASGPGVTTPALAPPAVPAQQAPPVETPAETPAEAPAAPVSTAPSAERLLLGGGLLAAGVLVALSARRGPFVRPSDTGPEQQLRLAATPHRADLLDRALRSLSAACTDAGRPLPEIAVAYCDDDAVTLSLVGAAGAPPAPWTAVSDGRGWTVRDEDLPGSAPDVAAPYPALAGIAVSDRTDVLVDLEAAPGLVSLEGDPGAAREVATSLLVELATNLWSDGVRVTAVGFGEDFSAVAPDLVSSADVLGDVLGDLEDESAADRSWLRSLGAGDVLSGRAVRGADRRPPRVVVLSGPPTAEEAERLQALLADGRTPLAVVCVGTAPAARWRFTVDAAGELDLGVLGVRATARRLSRDAYLPLLAELRGADEARTTTASQFASLAPRAALEEVLGTGAAGPRPTGPAASGPRLPHGTAAADVRLLGPVEVQAPGPVDPAARPLLTEVVVAAALHPDGLHEAVLRAEVWPRGVGDDVLSATLSAVQAWLGTGADGRPRLRTDEQGRWVLAPDVHSDWDVLQACAAAPEDSSAGAVLILEHALRKVRGEAFSVTGAGFGSLAFHRAARDARLVGTAVARRAASLALDAGDAARAVSALRAGVALVPAAEVLWRELLRVTASTDAAATADVAAEAYAALRAAGLRPEPETDALVQQLAPQARRDHA